MGPSDDEAWAAVVENGVEEGGVNLYTILPPVINDRIIEKFTEVCPDIEITVTRGTTELRSQIDAQIASGSSNGADIFITDEMAWLEANAERFAELKAPESLSLASDSFVVPGKVPQIAYLPWTMITWNTEEFPEGFGTLEDLLDPAVRGRIGMREGVVPSYVAFLQFQEDTFGADFLTALGDQEPKFYPSAVGIIQAVASGELGVGYSGSVSQVKELQGGGAPIDYVVSQPTLVIPYGAPIIDTGSDRTEAAQVFMAFLQSEAGQTELCSYGDAACARADISGSIDMEGATISDTGTITDEDVATWTSKFNEYFG